MASFGNEDILVGFLEERLKVPAAQVSKKANVSGLAFGFSNMVMFIIYGLTFYLGAVLNRKYDLDLKDMLASMFAVLYASFGAGNNN